MRDLKRMVLGISLLFLALAVVACGGSTSTSSSSTTPTSSSTTPTKAPGSPTASSSSSVLMKTAVVTVNGKPTTILTNTQGRTLYYSKSDTATKVACTGDCAKIWPPLLFTGTGLPTSATALQGKLTVVTDANGKQVEYNGHPLYTYSLDTAPGQTHGEGVKGVWFVVTPNLASQSAS
jgi:predicted lipoprotein with Yx(FWY)xxD motif